MPIFRVRVSRCSKVWETGYHMIDTDTAQHAEDDAAQMDDPEDMLETGREIDDRECEVMQTREDPEATWA